MSIRPRMGVEVPELTARVARASNPAGTTAMWVRDRLDGLWADEDFAGWYPRDGRPGISPAQLATVSVLQFLLDLSDRDAAEAVRCRIDFKYALGLDLDDPGFHFSVLGDSRERLLEEGRADQLLDLALARLKEGPRTRSTARCATRSRSGRWPTPGAPPTAPDRAGTRPPRPCRGTPGRPGPAPRPGGSSSPPALSSRPAGRPAPRPGRPPPPRTARAGRRAPRPRAGTAPGRACRARRRRR